MTEKELYQYQMTAAETEIWNRLKNLLKEDRKTMLIPDEFAEWIERLLSTREAYDHDAGYHMKEGYYYVEEGDRGSLYLKCYESLVL